MEAARGGFSLIEVLMAVIIASIAGLALMESAAQGRRAFDIARSHQNTAESVALVALSAHTIKDLNFNSTAALFSSRYPIDNDRILDKLNTYSFSVKSKPSHRWDIPQEGNSTQKAVAAISANAIEKITIDINDQRASLYGLSGEGW